MGAVATGARRRRGRRRFLRLAALAVGLVACGDDPTGSVPLCSEAPRLDPGDAVEGELTEDDTRRGGVPIDYYSVLLGTPTRLTVLMTTSAFDPFLYLIRETGEPFAQGFDPTGAADTVPLSAAVGAGCVLIGASGWSTTSRGRYTLTVGTAVTD